MDETIGSAEIDERPEIAHPTDAANARLAGLQRFHQLAAFLVFPLSLRLALRHDQTVAMAVDFDDLDANHFPANPGQSLLAAALAHAGRDVTQVGDGHKPANAAVGYDDAALVVANHFAFEYLSAGEQGFGLDPVLIQPRQMDGDD